MRPGFICVVVSSLHTTVGSLHDDSMVCEDILWSLDTRIAHRFEVYCFGFVFMNDGTVRMCPGEEGRITQGIRPRNVIIESQNPQPASGPPWSRTEAALADTRPRGMRNRKLGKLRKSTMLSGLSGLPRTQKG